MRLKDDEVERSNKRGVAVVHVDNVDDLVKAQVTEEAEPEHWITNTLAMPALTVVPALEVDPKRVEVVLSIVGTGNAFICHSYAAASKAAQGSVTDGALVASPFSTRLHGTGPLWVVAASGATGMTVSTWQSRRQ